MEGLLLPNCRHNESISHHCDVIAYAALVIKATTHKETSNIFTEANESLIVTATHVTATIGRFPLSFVQLKKTRLWF